MNRNTFSFTGDLVLPKEDSRRPLARHYDKNGRKMLSVSFGVASADNNREYVELFGAENDVIRTFDADGNKIEIDWNNRFDENVAANVANYRKYTVSLGDGRKTFITTYDAAKYLEENLPNYTGRVTVTGNMTRDNYNGNYVTRYNIENVYAASDKTENGLLVFADIAYNRDSLDTTDWKEKHRLVLNGYLSSYVSSEKKNMWFHTTFTFNADDYDLKDEMGRKRVAYIKRFLEIKSADMVHMKWAARVVNGTEIVEFNESMLTELQREEVALGLRTVDEFRPRGSIYGNRVMELRLIRPDTRQPEFSNGVVDMGISEDDFQDNVFIPVQVEDFNDAMNAPVDNKTATQKESDNLFDDDLFG